MWIKNKKKTINKFAILIVLLILVPEIIGHSVFDKPHPSNSSIKAAVALTNKVDRGYMESNFGCHLAVKKDTASSNITRADGLEGEYGRYECGTG